MELSVILMVQRDLANLQSCIIALRRALAGADYELIAVVDEREGECARWLHAHEKALLVENPSSRCLAAAWNCGCRAAGRETLLFLNGNVLLAGRTCQLMYRALYGEEHMGACGVWSNTGHHLGNQWIRNVPPLASLEELYAYADWVEKNIDPLQSRMYLEGFCLMVRREAIRRVGLLDERFVGDTCFDVDFSLRLLQAGYRLCLAPAYVHCNASDDFSDMAQALPESKRRFAEKWGFDVAYSTNIRHGLLAMLDLTRPNLAFLDIGCSCGGNLMAIKERNPGASVYGIELNPHAAHIAGLFGEVYTENIETFYRPEWQGKFDAIIMGDVIEHLHDPWQAVKKARDMLKPTGILLASIPNVLHISNLYDMMQGNWNYVDAGILDETHLRFFTKKSIQKLFEQSGMEILSLQKTIVPLSADMEKFQEALLKLPGIAISTDELKAYQYLVKAVRK